MSKTDRPPVPDTSPAEADDGVPPVRQRVRIHTAPLQPGEPPTGADGRAVALPPERDRTVEPRGRAAGREVIFDVSDLSVHYGANLAMAAVTL